MRAYLTEREKNKINLVIEENYDNSEETAKAFTDQWAKMFKSNDKAARDLAFAFYVLGRRDK